MSEDDPSMRQQIENLVHEFPGLHLREVARQLDTSIALVEYHVEQLVGTKAVEMVRDQRNHRLFPPGLKIPRKAIIALREGKRLQITLELLSSDATHTELVERTGLGKSTLSFHLRRMEEAGLIAKGGASYHIVNPAVVRQLVADNQPTPDLLSKFSGLWEDLYG